MSPSGGGYYRMHRGWMDGKLFAGEPYGERAAWIWLIESAAWKDTKTRRGAEMVPIARGQFLTSLRVIGAAWGWHRNRVQRFLTLLKNESMIGTEIGTGQTLITICNYDKYQAEWDSNGTDVQQRTGQQRDSNGTHKKKVKKEEEDSEASASAVPPADPAEAIWTKGVAIVGERRRSLLGKLRKEYGELALLEAIIETEHESPIEPLEYLIGCCKRRKKGDGPSHSRAVDILGEAARAADEREGNCGPLEAAAGSAWGAEELGDGSAALYRLPVRYSA